ncbi:MAG: hypothetical protein V9H69_25530 [Anaerolineae bacterium]
MSADLVERDVRRAAAQWAFIQRVATVDKTDVTVKLRLTVDVECFIQVYANTVKQLASYTLVLSRSRIYGRDCEGGLWHRHPAEAPEQHDFSTEGQRAVTLDEFLREAQQVLQDRGLL